MQVCSVFSQKEETGLIDEASTFAAYHIHFLFLLLPSLLFDNFVFCLINYVFSSSLSCFLFAFCCLLSTFDRFSSLSRLFLSLFLSRYLSGKFCLFLCFAFCVLVLFFSIKAYPCANYKRMRVKQERREEVKKEKGKER